MTLNVMNCIRCGKLSMRTPSEVCPACLKELEKQCQDCINYIRENNKTTLQEVSDGTGVPVKQIIRFIREGRISVSRASNLTYPCENCGELIQEQTLCESCRQKLAKELRDYEQSTKVRDEPQQQEKLTFQIKDRLKRRN